MKCHCRGFLTGYLGCFGKSRTFHGRPAIDVSVSVPRGYSTLKRKVIYDRFWVRVVGYNAEVKLKDARKGDYVHATGWFYTTRNLSTGIELVKLSAEWIEITHGQWMNWCGMGKRIDEAIDRGKLKRPNAGDDAILGLVYNDVTEEVKDTDVIYNDAEVLLTDDGDKIRKREREYTGHGYRKVLVPKSDEGEVYEADEPINADDEAKYITEAIEKSLGRAGGDEA